MAFTEAEKAKLFQSREFLENAGVFSKPILSTGETTEDDINAVRNMFGGSTKAQNVQPTTAPTPAKVTPKKKGFLESFTEGMAEGAESITTAGGLTKKIPYLGKAWEVASGAVVPTTLTKSAAKVTKGESLTPGEMLFSTLEALPMAGQGVKAGSKIAKTAAKEYLPNLAKLTGDVAPEIASKAKSVMSKLTPKPAATITGVPEISSMTGKELKSARTMAEDPNQILSAGREIADVAGKVKKAAMDKYGEAGETLKALATDVKTAKKEVGASISNILKKEGAKLKDGEVVVESGKYYNPAAMNHYLSEAYKTMKLSGVETAKDIRNKLNVINEIKDKAFLSAKGNKASRIIGDMKNAFEETISKLPGGDVIMKGQKQYAELINTSGEILDAVKKGKKVDSDKVFNFMKNAAKEGKFTAEDRVSALQKAANEYGLNVKDVTPIVKKLATGMKISSQEAPLAQTIIGEAYHVLEKTPIVGELFRSIRTPRFVSLLKEAGSSATDLVKKPGGKVLSTVKELTPSDVLIQQMMANLLGTGFEELVGEDE